MFFSCIIPTYNEWPRIGKVLETLLECREIEEIIIVNDGSTDTTREIIDSFTHIKLTKIHLEKNSGKTNAIFTGIQQAQWDYIVTIDSDLLNLTPEHITLLIEPVRTWTAQVTLSIRENSLSLYKFFGTDFVSGERVIPRIIFEDESFYTSWPGFWLEVKMNQKIIEKKLTIKNVYLPLVITPRKSLKYGFYRGTIADLRMTMEILSVISPLKIIHQLWYFSRFRKQ